MHRAKPARRLENLYDLFRDAAALTQKRQSLYGYRGVLDDACKAVAKPSLTALHVATACDSA
jgi:hypothetical protein